MNEIIKRLSSDKTIWWGIIVSSVLLVLTVVLTFLFYTSLPPVIPLFNQLPWGMSRLATKITLLLPSIIVFGFLVINSVLAHYIYEKTPVLSRILSMTTLLNALLSLVFVFRIIRLIV